LRECVAKQAGQDEATHHDDERQPTGATAIQLSAKILSTRRHSPSP
jgi:hypothetical protein